MTLLTALRSQLEEGDCQVIARVADCSPELVIQVLNSKFEPGDKEKKIVEIARKVIELRTLLSELQKLP